MGDILSGKWRAPQALAADADEAARTAQKIELETYQEKNGILNGRLLLRVLQGVIGYASPAVATVIAHGPAHKEINGDGYAAIQALRSKYDVTGSVRTWDLEERLSAANMQSGESWIHCA